jgi:hypothetical protein
MYRSGQLCGACVRMVCADSVCKDALLRESLFMITDSCRDCQGSNLVVSAAGFGNLTGDAGWARFFVSFCKSLLTLQQW